MTAEIYTLKLADLLQVLQEQLTELQAILTDAETAEECAGALDMFLRGLTPDPDTRYSMVVTSSAREMLKR